MEANDAPSIRQAERGPTADRPDARLDRAGFGESARAGFGQGRRADFQGLKSMAARLAAMPAGQAFRAVRHARDISLPMRRGFIGKIRLMLNA